MIEQFLIANKSGGMIYKYEDGRETDVNSLLILTSTFHSLNELSRNVLESKAFSQEVVLNERSIFIYRTLTGIAFIFVYKRDKQARDRRGEILRVFESVYSHFCDYVLSNPFYAEDMPIWCGKFKPEQFFIDL